MTSAGAEALDGQEAVDVRVGRFSTLAAIPLTALIATRALGQTQPIALLATMLVSAATIAVMFISLAMPRWRRPAWAIYPVLWCLISSVWGMWATRSGAGWSEPWVWGLSPYAVALAALRYRLGAAIAIAVAPPVLALAASVAASRPISPDLATDAALYLANAWFAVLVLAARHHLFEAWLSTLRVRQVQRRAAVSALWQAERLRLAALIHDQVLAVLTAGAQVVGMDTSTMRADVQRAQQLLAGRPRVTTGDVPLHEITDRVSILAAAAPTRLSVLGGGDATIPGSVADALVEATAEALRNCARHARPGTAAITLDLGEASVVVRISDDGPGFDPASIAPDRLGVTTSIIARMQAVSGGDAVVSSHPGQGTTVTLSWNRSGAAPTAPAPLDEPGHSLAVVSGVGSPASRVVLMFAWIGGLTWFELNRLELSSPLPVALAMAWVLAAMLLVSSPRELPWWGVAVISAAATLGTIAMLLQSGSDTIDQRWLIQIGADLLGLLALRGRVLAAVVGFLAQVVAALTLQPGGEQGVMLVGLLAVPVVTVAAGAIWNRSLRVSLKRMDAERGQLDHAQLAAEAAGQANRRATQWLGDLARLAEPALLRLGTTGLADPELRQLCLNTATAIRDRLRAPSLTGGLLDQPSANARARGVRVDMLDDSAAEQAVSDDLLRRVAELIDRQLSGRVVVRALPPGRPAAISVLTDDGRDVQRVELKAEDPSAASESELRPALWP